jgi:uncharacterized protein YggU (UPF0235/DUF167 family)
VQLTSRILEIRVKPNSREECLTEQPDGTWLACIKAPPVDGRANAALIALVARQLGCRRAQVSIKAGGSGRRKLVKVEG